MIATKQEMYKLLAAGALGNTLPQWFQCVCWLIDIEELPHWSKWGIRSLTPGGPSRMYVDTADVIKTLVELRLVEGQYNISPMVDCITTVRAWLEVWQSPAGLVVYGVQWPAVGRSWRGTMATEGRHWEGTRAKLLLREHLNENAYDDLLILLEAYPDHIVELSALEDCIGLIPHRNAIVWEVRAY